MHQPISKPLSESALSDELDNEVVKRAAGKCLRFRGLLTASVGDIKSKLVYFGLQTARFPHRTEYCRFLTAHLEVMDRH